MPNISTKTPSKVPKRKRASEIPPKDVYEFTNKFEEDESNGAAPAKKKPGPKKSTSEKKTSSCCGQ